ncbi:MAG: methionine adenosyltransferase [Promethearchaeota archaeon]|nr:MAG: methionine adenosyltransferase [Candidatus Lokiarchaeota archaeon]TFG23595.1 MAG: methionine adenosyltransferase [Candidatus Lokiarchaeota archaeon]
MLRIDKANFLAIEDPKNSFPELAERKGIGHPDSVCDAAADACSRALCKYYFENFGRYYHHNVDKAALVGGISKPEFGGGVILEPEYFLIVGRAINQILKENKLKYIPVATICLDACRQTVSNIFRNLDIQKDIQFDYAIRPGSIDLTGVFEESDAKEQVPLANDTSFGVGYAPYSDLEKITLEAEKLLNSDAFKDKCKGSGEDIKVMTQRVENKIDITLCCAMVSGYINDKDEYINYTNQMKDAVLDLAAKIIPKREVRCAVNVGDNIEKEILFLTITGTSAEAGDDGEVGRGNRSNGLITPCRTMSLEAVCGKNPINHVGKIYNVLATNMAREIIKRGQGDIIEAHVKLLSQIGRPITDPWVNSISLIPAENVSFESIRKIAEEVSADKLSKENIIDLRERLIAGKEQVF